jgi:hypothetical protein
MVCVRKLLDVPQFGTLVEALFRIIINEEETKVNKKLQLTNIEFSKAKYFCCSSIPLMFCTTGGLYH